MTCFKERIFVTGSEGFFASRFINFYKNAYEVIGCSRSQLDIANEDEVSAQIRSASPKFVVHTAAISDTSVCEDNPDLSHAINVMGSANVAKACAAANAKLIHLSSDQVYNGNRESGPFKEDCRVSPATVYGRHKLEAEKEIMKVLADPVILRLTWLFGLSEEGRKTSSNILWNIIRAEKEGRAISLPVNEYRGITDIYDLIREFEKVMCLPGGIYNTGSENDLSTYEIGMRAAAAMGFPGEGLVMKDEERYKYANRDLRISNEKLRNAGVVFPETSEAIKKITDRSFKPIR